ncbi:4'-phosphopantetheinyl transferase family protein [Vibrio kanaloae]|uniref:4'-phosphopantetheinyl transferase family protein n=1 Tax=Vibrio kanaloae TaxID=170673 RepID=UPI001EFE01E8|nr:4'-phosphopantetheinyl transferase superfamily protein [Vibrio kanaloae]MCG9556254.1 4'-phosphopantetheinyl transferase superfamily protein [Vibrio kanaloae]
METSVIDLWFCSLNDLDEGSDHVSRLKQKLTADEVAKVERYRMPSSQTQALYVRSCLRAILSRYFCFQPEEWRFEYGEKGKPSLVEKQQIETGLNFNISHSKEYLLIAVCQTKGQPLQLGVDIEHARISTNIAAIMKHYFSESEISDFLELDDASQRERFFDLWALKESYIKATGKGLATSLKSFSFNFSNLTKQTLPFSSSDFQSVLNGEIRLYSGIGLDLDAAEIDDASISWQCRLGRLDDQFRFAVTLGGATLPMHLEMKCFPVAKLLG